MKPGTLIAIPSVLLAACSGADESAVKTPQQGLQLEVFTSSPRGYSVTSMLVYEAKILEKYRNLALADRTLPRNISAAFPAP